MSVFFPLRGRERSLNTIIQKLKILFTESFLGLKSNRKWLILNIYLWFYTSFALGEFANFLSCHWVLRRNFHLQNRMRNNWSLGSPWQPHSPLFPSHTCALPIRGTTWRILMWCWEGEKKMEEIFEIKWAISYPSRKIFVLICVSVLSFSFLLGR